MENLDVAQTFFEIADLLEWKGEEPFRIRAYRRAAQAVAMLAEPIVQVAREGRLQGIADIGKATADKIIELLATGSIERLESLRQEIPKGLREMIRLPGVGVKAAQLFYHRLGIDNLAQLEQAIHQGALRDLPGIDSQKEAAILEAIRKWAS